MLGAKPLMLDRAPDHNEELIDLERLLQVVKGAELHRLDCTLDRGVSCHHEDLWTLTLLDGRAELSDQVQTGHRRHEVIDNEHVEQLTAQESLGFSRARSLDDLVSLTTERRSQGAPNLYFVVNQKDRTVNHHSTLSTSTDGRRGSSIRMAVP